MPEPIDNSNYFIKSAEEVVMEHLSNDQFGVSELAEAMNMSRSSLLRKIKSATGLSASQFIRKIRLARGMELLRENELNVSEVSYQTGFGSVSYFVKCFREEYGYPPGEAASKKIEEMADDEVDPADPLQPNAADNQAVNSDKRLRPSTVVISALVVIVAVVISVLSIMKWNARKEVDKSIAVLPFKNQSADESNTYFVNGLMESTLGNLQKMSQLSVVSRTSSEKYRESNLSIPEIAEKLGVNYVLEGSGQKSGDRVLLRVQLIDAATDHQVWTAQYDRKVDDIFNLQNDIAKEIASAIRIIVTPEELEIIEKRPTNSLIAYDYYLQALEPFYSRSNEGLYLAIDLFERAIQEDEEFAIAYANIAVSYFYLDLFQEEKSYTDKINEFSDKALLYDSKSDISLISKALYYIHAKEFQLALPHLMKALEYNPNSTPVVKVLSDFYAFYVPNTEKYLEYALRATQLDRFGEDSVSTSYSYVHLSNALVQNGFFEEALDYIDLALKLHEANYFAPHLRIFVKYAKDKDVTRTIQSLVVEWEKDTSRLDILQDIGKMYLSTSNFDTAYYYFKKLVDVREAQSLDRYIEDNAMIALAYREMGHDEKAEELIQDFLLFCEQDQSIYRSIFFAFYYSYRNDIENGMVHFKKFAEQENYQFWFTLLSEDPLIQTLKEHHDFTPTMNAIVDRFWKNHKIIRTDLGAKGLL